MKDFLMVIRTLLGFILIGYCFRFAQGHFEGALYYEMIKQMFWFVGAYIATGIFNELSNITSKK
jgi:hypothetical protein